MAETLERTLQSVGRFRRTVWSFQPFGNEGEDFYETDRNKRELWQSDFSVNRVTTKRSYYIYFWVNTGEVAASKMTVVNIWSHKPSHGPSSDTNSSKKQREVIHFSSLVFAHQKPSDTENVRFYNQLLETHNYLFCHHNK